MRFKLDENLSPSLAHIFNAAGHEAHAIVEQSLGGRPDEAVIDVCARETRVLVTLDLDFANIRRYPVLGVAVGVRFRYTLKSSATLATLHPGLLCPHSWKYHDAILGIA